MNDKASMSKHVWVFRSGGLGDFLLTIPFLKVLSERADLLTVVTRPSYARLASNLFQHTQWLDVESRSVTDLFRPIYGNEDHSIRGADVYTFLGSGDPEFLQGLKDRGCRRVVLLESRPIDPPHVTLRMFETAGLDPPPDLLQRAWLSGKGPEGCDVFIHPGSGSPSKNAPLPLFVERLRKMGSDHPYETVYIVLGEADLGMRAAVEEISSRIGARLLITPDLQTLKRRLEHSAARFIGNDSGVTHLASLLGVPVDVFFLSTDPAIWAPIGPHVRIARV